MIRILKYSEMDRETVFDRNYPTDNVTDIVSAIIEDVKTRGDRALLDYTKRFDKAELTQLQVSAEEVKEAEASLDPEFLAVLQEAADNIKAFHSKQIRSGFIMNEKRGVVCGQKIIPMNTVGVYVPGGTAVYPSTVLMDTIPAKLAGCPNLVMVTPPGPDGKISPNILAAAKIAGVDKIFKVGGAQAVAALAYGTESVPRADKIVGPGNAFVAEAKRQVFGRVAIDMIAGPSEILIVADGKSNPVFLAADMLSQAEHDKNASAVLVTDSEELALKVSEELETQLSVLPREAIARPSIDNNGKIIVADSIEQAIEISNEIAPEHLEVCVDNPFDYLDMITSAGSVFMGRNCPEALGDYLAGPNHTLPTGGSARFSSPLSVDDFIKKTQYTYFTADALDAVAQDIALFARKEGLEGHARSAVIRSENR
ncbi:MAG: histidinol dehydrogenase [Clostridia bacterium]|nr:histidinol dehydrogenase [Clostridia bacterium]